VLTVEGISQGRLTVVTPATFGKLDVDPAYQRGETSMVSDIINALQAGGLVLDPVTLRKRPWAKDREQLWVVDGHQRVCAFQELNVPFQAMVHESESLDAEKKFFLALNSRKAVGADVIAKSWTGPCARLLMAASQNPAHTLYERVSYAQGFNESRLGAMVVVRGAWTATSGMPGTGGSAQRLLSRLDVAIGPPEKKLRAEMFLQLMGDAFPKGSCSLLVSTALSVVAFERWSEASKYPAAQQVERLRKVSWRMEVPVLTAKFRPVLVELIRRIWKAAE
jgi:hypothetical protein